MDFSKSAFHPSHTSSSLSNDTMDHAKMVMACRFGWNAGPDNATSSQGPAASQPISTSTFTPFPTDNFKTKRFAPCSGRLYHQLSCSHRIRTDLVEDCGANCLDPSSTTSDLPFYCHECVENESNEIWSQREMQHNAAYPVINQMTKEQYEQWYSEHRQLEAEFAKDRKAYSMDLMSRMRPSNVCSAIEASKEELDFAGEIDSLSLAMVQSNESTTFAPPTQARPYQRISLPTDTSEQLHWQLNSLAIDRGSCGVEYSTNQSPPLAAAQAINEEDLWRIPRK